MSRLAPEIAAFVRVAELGSFAAVAAETGYTSSGVSRMITRLEDHLGAKLFFRSTRSLSLTSEGATFLLRAKAVLEAIENASGDLSEVSKNPHGHIRINCGTAFANHKLAPLITEFSQIHPKISLEVLVTDHRIDPISSQSDITIRVGDLEDSSLVAVTLGVVTRIIAASPGYLAKHGTPNTPEDLAHHNCLLLRGFPSQANWPFRISGKAVTQVVSGNVTSDSAETLLSFALSDVGVIRLGDFLGADALAAGRLVPILTDIHAPTQQPITALVQDGRQNLPRIRVLLDFLKSHV